MASRGASGSRRVPHRAAGSARGRVLIARRALHLATAIAFGFAATAAAEEVPAPDFAALVERVRAVEVPTRSAAEYAAAATAYGEVLAELAEIEGAGLPLDDEIDLQLLRSYLEVRRFEIEEAKLHEVVPVRYFALSATDGLFLRPCGAGDEVIEKAIGELERLPEILENGRRNLKRPARTWTENALVQARYARMLLSELVPTVCAGEALRARLVRAAAPALESVSRFEMFLRDELLGRSDRAPTWRPEQIAFYQRVEEWLPSWDADAIERLALEEEERTAQAMRELARRIHPSGSLETVWRTMGDQAPPWPEVEAMARWYVEHASAWLRGPGRRLLELPEQLDYGVATTTPMARRILSFGGASYGPTVGGRLSGYYVLTPLEPWLDEEERRQRLRSYNPYWTHVISYHEWVGHNVQRVYAQRAARPVRKLYRAPYLTQAWSFYLEKLFEDEGYYDTLPHQEALQTRMARLQMRMWRIQRILTKVGMAKGTMTFDEAVERYVERIGMEPANAFIEVQRDSQSPASPGREILGERLILELREAYRERMGEHYDLGRFHAALLSHGDLPIPAVRAILLREHPPALH